MTTYSVLSDFDTQTGKLGLIQVWISQGTPMD